MSIRKLIKDGLIMRRSTTIHSRARARRFNEAVRKGWNFYFNTLFRLIITIDLNKIKKNLALL